MSNISKYGALAALMAAGLSTATLADTAETKGGITVKTDDGRFEAKVGGRIHFDTFVFDNDTTAPFGSSGAAACQGGSDCNQAGGTAFRRTYLTLTGKAYGWKYKFEHDFAAQGAGAAGAAGYREMWLSTNVGPGEVVIGQFKPFRGMEELTSSNEITMIERPVTSASGIYAGRQFLMGFGYKGIVADSFGYGLAVMNLGPANTTTEGLHYGGRVYFAPMKEDGGTLHLGLSASVDSEDTGSSAATAAFGYAGRRGPTQGFGAAGTVTPAPSAGIADQTTLAAEAAMSFGPATLQFEYAQATLDDTHLNASLTPADSDVTAYYLQGSWFVTGESKVYKMDRGAFGAPKPLSDSGAIELVARYEFIENGDQSATDKPCGAGAGAFTTCEATVISAGVNWYVNPNTRFMLNYYTGEADHGGDGKDEPDAVTLRTQFSF